MSRFNALRNFDWQGLAELSKDLLPGFLILGCQLVFVFALGLVMFLGLGWGIYRLNRGLEPDAVNAQVTIFEVSSTAGDSSSASQQDTVTAPILPANEKWSPAPDLACGSFGILCKESRIQTIADHHLVPDATVGAELSDGLARGTGEASTPVLSAGPVYTCGNDPADLSEQNKEYGHIFRAGRINIGYALDLRDIPTQGNNRYVRFSFRVHTTLHRLGSSRTMETTFFVDSNPFSSQCQVTLFAAGDSIEPGRYRFDLEIRALPFELAPRPDEAVGFLRDRVWSWMGESADVSDEFEVLNQNGRATVEF